MKKEEKTLRILLLLPHPPYLLSNGGRVRSYNLIKMLAEIKSGIQLDIICFAKHDETPDQVPNLKIPCRTLEVVERAPAPSQLDMIKWTWTRQSCLYSILHTTLEMRSRVREHLQSYEYDLVHVVTFYMIRNIPHHLRIPLLLETTAVEWVGMQRHLGYVSDWLLKLTLYADSLKQRREEIKAWRGAQACTAVSARDATYIAKEAPRTHTFMVPNGVDTDAFNCSYPEDKHPTIFFMGNYRYFPNVDAAILLAEEIFPLVRRSFADAKLILAGADATPRIIALGNLPGIQVTGYVVDHRPLLGSSWVIAAPLRSGTGTRIKMLEAMAMRKPIVTSPIGCEGLEIEHQKNVLVANTIEEFAGWTIELIRNRIMREQIGMNGRILAQSKYEWMRSARSLVNCYEQVIQTSRLTDCSSHLER